MSNHSKIKSKPYRNWVRGALGLFYLQKGLYPFTDRVTKAEHANIVQNLTPCTNCAIEDILPAHASGNVCLQTNKGRCNCRKRKNRNCATCSKIYDDIVLQHRFRDPYWVTDCSTWYNDHWQFAKCFLTTTSKGSNTTAAETDASGLLSIIINGEFFQSEIQCNIDPPNDSFSKVREIRNEILHNSTLDIADHDLTRYLQSMIVVLEDKKSLNLDPAAQAAVLKLKEILRDELLITTNEEACAIQTALNAIKVAKKQSEESIKVAKEQSEESIRKLAEETRNTIKASEEGIRKLAEESRNSVQLQTLESTTGIAKAEKHAIENVSTEFQETYEPEIKRLKLGHEDHENRLKAIEKEQQNLQMKQLKLENQVAELKATEEKHQTRIEYLKQKQGLQQYLVEEYQKHYVKTSISPLITRENVVNIRDVYVSPRMVEENEDDNKGNTSKAGNSSETNKKHIESYHRLFNMEAYEGNTSKAVNDRETSKKHIESYRDLFNTGEKRNQKIFVVGDVGTGKSSFCKMMMQNWCSSITKRRQIDESCVLGEDEVVQGEECNTCDMNQFDFLFYIPLREIPNDIDDTVDMIKAQLGKYTTLVDNIFTNDSERCLILADGLDEWTPPKSNRQSRHHGIPTSRLAGDSTILTTSRPSSRGILNMKSSEYDLRVTLLGLKDSSVQPMIKKYLELFDKASASTASDISFTFSKSFKDIHKAPMLLQQLIWLYCNNYDITHSRSSIYLHIVNAVLGWEYERTEHYPKLQSNSLEQLPLPESFDMYPRCQENRELLLLLGKIAYDAYITGNESSLVFGRYKLKQLGVSAEDIAAILQTGILTEINCADPTYDKSRLTFIHTSYVEFFAALYMCSCYLSKTSDAHSSVTPISLLEGLLAVTPETSVAEMLRLENVLIMICGLVPGLTEHVCECIYKLTPRAENMNDYMVKSQIQRLTFNCISEHNSDGQQTARFKLRHLNLECFFNMKRFSDIDPSSIETFILRSLSHGWSLLSSFLSQAVSLRAL
ncbi:uncharacterized protein LOC123531869 [Mercenaria mercenaria]|uniref:uncharacterized protein LOC123531869 n=1 Tax=Mercenaria mercenaria TaxID=6596 RepID=UPI00234EA70B|nr:uncharacterized protein LOC123531869 [Mercenaria mercenaria]